MGHFFEVRPGLWINADNVTHVRIDQLPSETPGAPRNCALIRMIDGQYVTATTPGVVASMLGADASDLWSGVDKEPF